MSFVIARYVLAPTRRIRTRLRNKRGKTAKPFIGTKFPADEGAFSRSCSPFFSIFARLFSRRIRRCASRHGKSGMINGPRSQGRSPRAREIPREYREEHVRSFCTVSRRGASAVRARDNSGQTSRSQRRMCRIYRRILFNLTTHPMRRPAM